MKARREGDERGVMGPISDTIPQILNHLEGRYKVKPATIRKDIGELVKPSIDVGAI